MLSVIPASSDLIEVYMFIFSNSPNLTYSGKSHFFHSCTEDIKVSEETKYARLNLGEMCLKLCT